MREEGSRGLAPGDECVCLWGHVCVGACVYVCGCVCGGDGVWGCVCVSA